MARGLKDDLPDEASKASATRWHDGQISQAWRVRSSDQQMLRLCIPVILRRERTRAGRVVARPSRMVQMRREPRRRRAPLPAAHPSRRRLLGYTSIFTGGNEAARNTSQATQLKSGV